MATGQNGDDDEPTRDRISFLRPLGDVADDPVVRPLGVLGLHLGNRNAAAYRCEFAFDAVLTLSSERFPLTTHHRPLTDGEGNDWRAFAGAVDTAKGTRPARGERAGPL